MLFCTRASHLKNQQLRARGNAAPAIDQRARRIAPLAILRVAAVAHVFLRDFWCFRGGFSNLDKGGEKRPKKMAVVSPLQKGIMGLAPPSGRRLAYYKSVFVRVHANRHRLVHRIPP